MTDKEIKAELKKDEIRHIAPIRIKKDLDESILLIDTLRSVLGFYIEIPSKFISNLFIKKQKDGDK